MGLLDRFHLLEPARDFYNWLHYLFSFDIRRDNAEYLRRGSLDGLPIPTPRLMHLVSGNYRLENLFVNGRHGAECIRRILGKHSIAMDRLGSILDFGCGCGRVTRFDFVYAISVFTHLPREMQKPWLDELVRVTAPGGYLYITVLGTQHRSKMSAAEWESFTAGGMIVQWSAYPGTNICRVFHSEEYFRMELTAGVTVVDFIPGGAEDADRQDVFLLRKNS